LKKFFDGYLNANLRVRTTAVQQQNKGKGQEKGKIGRGPAAEIKIQFQMKK
jgi:hypothetical protein